MADLNLKLLEGAAAALVTEEAFLEGGTQALEKWVANQPAWSDFPFIVLTSRATSPAAHAYRLRLLDSLGNVSMLERPLNTVTLVSSVRAALRARRRQYEVQDHLLDRETSAAQLEDLVRERTGQLEQANEQLRQQIAERRQAEAALQQAQKMEVIGQMTGGVAHDFNNLLTVITASSELMLALPPAERGDELIETMLDAAQRGARLTRQLLALGRKNVVAPRVLDVNDVIRSNETLLRRTLRENIELRLELTPGAACIEIDPNELEQLLLNLVLNAR
ncbi:MAG TPA: histidine kinase dimerization/phospho-acceptor domain-containing protein, partial [Burkholderiaceae bacterium]|nr:histidine kinase dimerization/phospho-acceptor domain-containing protein [Burkholderiaceae bacterium]